MNISSIGKSILSSPDFRTLLSAGFLDKVMAKTGGGAIVVKNRAALQQYFNDKFPSELTNNYTAVSNVHSLRNTKAGKRISQNVILLKGENKITINEQLVDLKFYTQTFGTFATALQSLTADSICLVENLDSFFLADKVIGSDPVFIHTYGGLGRSMIEKISAKRILVFPDYDFKGLGNYLLVKSIFNHAELFVPADYDDLFRTKSRTIKTKLGREQQPNKSVIDSVDPMVVKIRTEIYQHRRFLEQQALFL